MDAYEWLGTWEPLEAPGRHTRLLPADGATGYLYGPPIGSGVSRAIPVDGAVTDVPPSWMRCPQVRFWLEPERTGIWKRFIKWLKGGEYNG